MTQLEKVEYIFHISLADLTCSSEKVKDMKAKQEFDEYKQHQLDILTRTNHYAHIPNYDEDKYYEVCNTEWVPTYVTIHEHSGTITLPEPTFITSTELISGDDLLSKHKSDLTSTVAVHTTTRHTLDNLSSIIRIKGYKPITSNQPLRLHNATNKNKAKHIRG